MVDYDQWWIQRFQELAGRVRRSAGYEGGGRRAHRVDLGAWLGGQVIADVSDGAVYVPALEVVGFELRVREPHRMLRTPVRDVHLHLHVYVYVYVYVYEPDRAEVRDYLDLCDWLRVDTAERELHAATKRRLAQ